MLKKTNWIVFLTMWIVLRGAGAGEHIVLKNDKVLRDLEFDGAVWRTVRFARGDGSDSLKVNSDEFHVLFLDDSEVSLAQFRAAGPPIQETKDGSQRVSIRYVWQPQRAPRIRQVAIDYTLGRDGFLRKSVKLTMNEGEVIDRLEVERFSVDATASRGGRGEPVFVNNTWWFGVEYTAFYARHTDGNTPHWQEGPYDRMPSYPSVIGLDGRDIEKMPRPGLIRLMHFPGTVKKLPDGSFGIQSKTAVCGVRQPGLSMELSFFDYLNAIRKPLRSFIHYNNWYDPTGKNLSVENFVKKTFIPMRDALAPYGVKIDAMVPDNGWQNVQSIYEPSRHQFPKGWPDVEHLADELEAEGTHLGIWFALNGYSLDMKWGGEHGYREATRNANFSRWGRYYAISEPKYNAAVRESLTRLLRNCRLNYFKHDFNDMCDLRPNGQPQTDRHGHEAEVDATLELLALERRLRPDVYQNMTNWIWFSPWWLQHCDTIWMLSGDDGLYENSPQLSTLAMASLYRDVHLYKAWGLGNQRPLVPMSHLMTHGIIYTQSLYGGGQDSIRDFADYVMMYYLRGLKLKEWYFTPKLMNADHWRAVGTITRWADENKATLANAIQCGGDPGSGKTYGYVSWNGDKAILGIRNTTPEAAEITVPFDQSVFYRELPGREFRACVIYPYRAQWPATFRSGEPIKILIPGDSLLVMNLEPGRTSSNSNQLPALRWVDSRLEIPDEVMQRCEIQLVGNTALKVDGNAIKPIRSNRGQTWQIASFDLRPWRGKTVQIAIGTGSEVFAADPPADAWLIVDRPTKDAPALDDPRQPWAIAQGYRRQTMKLSLDPVAGRRVARQLTSDDWKQIRAAKVRIATFGLEVRVGGKCRIVTNDSSVLAEVPSNRRGDTWEISELDIPPEKVASIKPSNTLCLTRDRDADRFKFRGLALAVQLSDGTWIPTTVDSTVQTSHADWAYFEGRLFQNPHKSNTITIRFP